MSPVDRAGSPENSLSGRNRARIWIEPAGDPTMSTTRLHRRGKTSVRKPIGMAQIITIIDSRHKISERQARSMCSRDRGSGLGAVECAERR